MILTLLLVQHVAGHVDVDGMDTSVARPALRAVGGHVRVHDEEAAEDVPVVAPALTRDRIHVLPADWRRRFRDMVVQGDPVEAARRTSEIEPADADTAAALRALLKRYRLNEIEDLLSEGAGGEADGR